MNIAIIGAGSVGGNLARGWARHGHKIVFGVRDPRSARLQPLLTEIDQAASAAPVEEAVAGADVVVFATPWEATLGIARRAWGGRSYGWSRAPGRSPPGQCRGWRPGPVRPLLR